MNRVLLSLALVSLILLSTATTTAPEVRSQANVEFRGTVVNVGFEDPNPTIYDDEYEWFDIEIDEVLGPDNILIVGNVVRVLCNVLAPGFVDRPITVGDQVEVYALYDEASLEIYLSEPYHYVKKIVSELPDLAFQKVDFDKSEPLEDGDTVLFGAVIVNQGDGDAHEFVVEVHLDDRLFESGVISLRAHESATLWCDNPWRATTGTHTLTWVADTTNVVEESNENNNRMSRTFTVGPETVDFKFRGDILDIYDHHFEIEIREIMQDPENSLKVGDTMTIFVYDEGQIIGDIKVGSYVEVYADYEYGVHLSYHYIKLIGEPEIELTLTADRTSIAAGEATGVRFRLRNNGNAEARNIDISISLNEFLELTSGSAYQHYDSLSPGTSQSGAIMVSGRAGGTGTVYVTVTYYDSQGNSHRKSASVSIEVGKPDIDISITPEKITLSEGEVATVTITLTNRGNAEARSIDCSISLVFLDLEAGSTSWHSYSLASWASDSHNIDVKGRAEGSGSVDVQVTYYDVQGNRYEESASLTMQVTALPQPEVVPAAAAVVASTSATVLASQAAGRSAASGKSSWDWLDRLLRLRERGEMPLLEVEKGAAIERRIRRRREVLLLAAAILIVGSLLSFAQAPISGSSELKPIFELSRYIRVGEATETIKYIIDSPSFLVQAIVATSFILLISYIARLVFARYLGAIVEYKLWIVGILMLIASIVLFKTPYGAPAQVKMPKTTPYDVRGRLSLSVILVVIGTSVILYLFWSFSRAEWLRMGVLYGLALAACSSVPHKPLPGYMIYQYNKMLSLGLSVACFVLLFSYLDPAFGPIAGVPLAVVNIGISKIRGPKAKPKIIEVSGGLR